MKEIKPTGWLIDDGGAWQFTTKSDDLTVANRFNWKVTPLYSEQSLADIKAEAIGEVCEFIRDGFKPSNEDEHLAHIEIDQILVNYANRIKEG